MISIVMAYYNRRKLLLNTLYSISSTKYSGNIEVIIVDDASEDEHKIEDVVNLFPQLKIKVFCVKPEKKWWINPCIAFNTAFSFISGDKIIIQNPECLHTGDILSYVDANLKVGKYLSFGCYSIGHQKTKLISDLSFDDSFVSNVKSIIKPTNNIVVGKCAYPDKWYNHSLYNPAAINFCCAITRSDLNDLGGFDENYATGIAKDDREFITRIIKKGMDIIYVDDLFVIHQCHGYTNYSNVELVEKNNKLFEDTLKRSSYRVNNKIDYKVIL